MRLHDFLLGVALLLPLAGGAAEAKGDAVAGVIPLAAPPQRLRDAAGQPETDLVDPFQRRSTIPQGEGAMPGMSRTSFGEISDEFRILSIIIPQNTNTLPMALIKLHSNTEPQLVRPGDLVRINRTAAPAGARGGRRPAAAPLPDTLSALQRYTFYLYVKEIHATYIEVYQNKKSPDETIILSW